MRRYAIGLSYAGIGTFANTGPKPNAGLDRMEWKNDSDNACKMTIGLRAKERLLAGTEVTVAYNCHGANAIDFNAPVPVLSVSVPSVVAAPVLSAPAAVSPVATRTLTEVEVAAPSGDPSRSFSCPSPFPISLSFFLFPCLFLFLFLFTFPFASC